MMFKDVQFANPDFFWLLLLLPLAVLWYIFKRKEQVASLKISSVKGFSSESFLPKLKPLLFLLRLLALASIIVAMARPQTKDVFRQVCLPVI